jgi:hypothetical protein
VPEVRERYLTKSDHRKIEIWKPTRQINAMRANQLLRFQTEQPFELDISIGSEASQTIQSQAIGLGIHYADLPAMPESGTTISFSFNSEPVADWIGPTFSIQTF